MTILTNVFEGEIYFLKENLKEKKLTLNFFGDQSETIKANLLTSQIY
jgi:hypothetical protein